MDDPMIERFDFVGADGARLAAVLHRPREGVEGSVLTAHCFTCSKDLHTLTRLERRLVAEGLAVLRFDFTGLGDSGGRLADTTLRGNIGDLTRAAVALIERGLGPCTLLGHSLGGAAALLVASRLKTVERVIVLGAPSTATHVVGLLTTHLDELRERGEATIDVGGRPFVVGSDFVDDLGRHDVLAAVEDLGRPLLVLVPGDDEVVPPTHGETIHAHARPPRRLVVIDGADHLLTDPAHAELAADAVVAFIAETGRGQSAR